MTSRVTSRVKRQARATQRDRIRAALYAGAEMTALSALRDEGCAHLASRISELVAEGCPVKKKWALVESAYGGAARVVVYYVDPADRPVSAP